MKLGTKKELKYVLHLSRRIAQKAICAFGGLLLIITIVAVAGLARGLSSP